MDSALLVAGLIRDAVLEFRLDTQTLPAASTDTPVGLLRLDVAWPLDRRPEVDPGVKLYFGLGNVF